MLWPVAFIRASLPALSAMQGPPVQILTAIVWAVLPLQRAGTAERHLIPKAVILLSISLAPHSRHIGDLASVVKFYNYTANMSGIGKTDISIDTNDTTRANYRFGCANCHPVDLAKHLDGYVDVVLGTVENTFDVTAKVGTFGRRVQPVRYLSEPSLAMAPYNATTSTVIATAKGGGHSTPQWSQQFALLPGERCAQCHANSPAGVGRHMLPTLLVSIMTTSSVAQVVLF